MLDRIKNLLYFGGVRGFVTSHFVTLKMEYYQYLRWKKAVVHGYPCPAHTHSWESGKRRAITDIQDCLDMPLGWTCSILKIVSWKSFLLFFNLSTCKSNQQFLPQWILKIPLRRYPNQHIMIYNETESQILTDTNKKHQSSSWTILSLYHKTVSLLPVLLYNRCSVLTCWYLALCGNLLLLLNLTCNHKIITSWTQTVGRL